MKIVLCTSFGSPDQLIVEEKAALEPGPGEVVIAVHASGVGLPDALMVQGKSHVSPTLPFSPGCEVAGVIVRVGAGVATRFAGERVFAYVGVGGYAEEVCLEASRVLPIPPGMSFEIAASFALAHATAYHALKDRAGLRVGETVVVLGAAGGLGLAAVGIAKAMGARVVACASSNERLELCRQQGADDLINYQSIQLRLKLLALTEGKGVDVVFDPVGGIYSESVMRSLAREGRYLVVGLATDKIPNVPLNLLLEKGASILGVSYDVFNARSSAQCIANLEELLGWQAQGQLVPKAPISYALEEAGLALDALLRREVVGKAVLVMHR
ncbi:NADPH:quinone oxidoreductase family protein [Pseudomonas sp. NFACC07-1]|uniref:NADPH:quinone oxidoreductase family protein n=1 Tax=Pseudomonas sp. NFACC07-1 TaxID=1566239 RepID=UPI0008CAC854|nr:NADPH:quinone oxidoreductase family protein [Pseudomonas sp. NFACC07-1]SEI53102.1 NADPH2:quinone reductase [Pseudomonas sp. NFACC07-1]